ARLHILEKMVAAIAEPRAEMSPFAPRLLSFKIDPEMIGMVIGPGGKKIKGITEATGAKVDIEDDGTVTVSSLEGEKAKQAKAMIEAITFKPKAGDVFAGKVTRVIPIGAFVEFMPGQEGMIHISQLADYRVAKVEDEVNVGDEVIIKVREIDGRGRVNLTRLNIHPDEAAAAREASVM
ncbi:polyribonucleotide nucleotidyltransferase, partial [filamentous cyanobacterium CCP5]